MPSRDDKLRRLIAEQAAEWHAIQGEGPLSAEQAAELMRWLQTSPLHVAEYLAIAELERGIAEVARADATPLPSLLEDTAGRVRPLSADATDRTERLDVLQPRGRRGTRRRPRQVGWAFALAAAVAVVALAGGYWLAAGTTAETFTTGRGQEFTTTLPDHSVVRLDAESRVVVRFSRTRREVALERGQAYFDVAADPARPFRVRAGPVSIRDIGTVFNVRRHATATTVTVVAGHVQVWDAPMHAAGAAGAGAPTASAHRAAGPIASLGPGQQVRVDDHGRVLAQGSADLWQALAWVHGRITFDDVPIAEVAARFNRHNDTQIRIAEPSIGDIRITGTFHAHGVASFVRFLQGLPGVAVSTRGHQITVETAPRRK